MPGFSKRTKYVLIVCAIVALVSLLYLTTRTTEPDEDNVDLPTEVKTPVKYPDFSGDSAYKFIEQQLSFGPRVPGTPAHAKCYIYFNKFLRNFADTVYEQKASGVTYSGKVIPIFNLIASFNPEVKKRILLCAHWDTRPFADQDQVNPDMPIPGANDGASGPAVLMEIARLFHNQRPDVGVDIILFDSEDWGDASGTVPNSFCLGSQYWGKHLHKPGYTAEFGILLDMVGAPNAQFGYEGYSRDKAGAYVSLVWEKASDLGYNRYFKKFERGYVTDDHYYIMAATGIPVINIIDYDAMTPGRFGKYWHTHQDNISAINKSTLKAVGHTLMDVVYNY